MTAGKMATADARTGGQQQTMRPGRWTGITPGIAALAIGIASPFLGGCGSTQQTGEKGLVTFTASGCGGALSDLAGCDLKKSIAVGGWVDVKATRNSTGATLSLRTDLPAVLDVQPSDNGGSAIVGMGTGSAYLSATDVNLADIDRLSIKVAEIAQLAYNTVSTSFGTFRLQPVGDVDGTFDLNDGVTNFTLLFLQVDGGGQTLLGRDTTTAELSAGLNYQQGKSAPHNLQYELVRPSAAGMYYLTLRAKYGPGKFKLQINVK